MDARSVVRKNAGVVRSRSRLVFLTRSVVPLQLPVPAMLLPEPVRAWFRLLDTNPCLPALCLPARLPLGGNQIWTRNMELFFAEYPLFGCPALFFFSKCGNIYYRFQVGIVLQNHV